MLVLRVHNACCRRFRLEKPRPSNGPGHNSFVRAAVWLLAEVLLDAGRPASVRVAFRPVKNWPEIKRGGPELSTLSSADELPGSSASPLSGNLRTTIENTVQLP